MVVSLALTEEQQQSLIKHFPNGIMSTILQRLLENPSTIFCALSLLNMLKVDEIKTAIDCRISCGERKFLFLKNNQALKCVKVHMLASMILALDVIDANTGRIIDEDTPIPEIVILHNCLITHALKPRFNLSDGIRCLFPKYDRTTR